MAHFYMKLDGTKSLKLFFFHYLQFCLHYIVYMESINIGEKEYLLIMSCPCIIVIITPYVRTVNHTTQHCDLVCSTMLDISHERSLYLFLQLEHAIPHIYSIIIYIEHYW